MRALAVAVLLACGCNDGLTPDYDLSGIPGGDASFDSDGGAGPMWTARKAMPGPRQETAVVALNGKIYVIGGFDASQTVVATVEIYDPATNLWSTGPSLPKPVHHANAAVAGGKLYILGALETGLFTANGDVLRLDGVMWTTRTSMPAGSERGASFIGAIGDKIYVAGGWRNATAVNDFASYDTIADNWMSLPVLPAPRDHGVSAVVGGKLYAISGRMITFTSVNPRVDVFNPVTGSWSPAAPLPVARGGAAAGVVGGRIIVAGGEGNPANPKGVFPNVDLYDPTTNKWSSLDPMLTPRHGTGGAVIGNTFYVPGGADHQNYGAVPTVEAITF